jgi:CheY-like chemotaxis protein
VSDTEDPLFAAPAHILLVEDAPDQAFLLSSILRRLGPFRITVAQDGVRALELADQGDFDLVLTDLNLPGIDGFELTREIKARRPDLPVLAVTGYETPSHTEGARRAGANAVAVKPIGSDDLARHLKALLPDPPGEPNAPGVLAVGVRLDDVLFGCGGSLLAHGRAGHRIRLALLHGTGDPRVSETVRMLDAEVVDLGVTHADQVRSLDEVVAGAGIRLAYVPSPCDADPERSSLHEVARHPLATIEQVLGYAAPTSTLDFRPGTYRDIADYHLGKLALLERLAGGGSPEVELARAHALYWGRFADFRAVEPFETLRAPDHGSSTSATARP